MDCPQRTFKSAAWIPRDEGLLYERLLREQGILTRLDMCVHPFFAARKLAHFSHRYPGVPHGFSSMLPEMTATKKWDADLREGLKWVLAAV
jgi:hypothetical protein